MEQVWHHKDTKRAKQANLRATSPPNVGTGIWSTSYADYRTIVSGSCRGCSGRSLGEFSPSTRNNCEQALTKALNAGASHFPYFAKIDACSVEIIETGSFVAPKSE
jgi:hypothetical protein